MIHIESKTGKSYPIADMTENHIIRTIHVYISRARKVNEEAEHNPRYLDDIHKIFERLALYYFIAEMSGYMNPIIKNHIEYVFEQYRENRKGVFIPK